MRARHDRVTHALHDFDRGRETANDSPSATVSVRSPRAASPVDSCQEHHQRGATLARRPWRCTPLLVCSHGSAKLVRRVRVDDRRRRDDRDERGRGDARSAHHRSIRHRRKSAHLAAIEVLLVKLARRVFAITAMRSRGARIGLQKSHRFAVEIVGPRRGSARRAQDATHERERHYEAREGKRDRACQPSRHPPLCSAFALHSRISVTSGVAPRNSGRVSPVMQGPRAPHPTRACRRRSAFEITETELKLIAALAIIGLRSQPSAG